MSHKKKRVDPDLVKVRAIAKSQLKALSKKSVTYTMSLIDFNGSGRTYPRSAANVAWFAYIFRQLKTAPHEVMDAFLESGMVTRDESLLVRQLRSASTVESKKEDG